MAELALKIGPSFKYNDGDILSVFNNRRIRCTHAQHICHVKLAGGGVGAHRDDSHVSKDWFEHTHQYRTERISRTEMRRTNLITLDEEIFTGPEFNVAINGGDVIPVLFPDVEAQLKTMLFPRPSVAALLSAAEDLGFAVFNNDTGTLTIDGLEVEFTVWTGNSKYTWVEDYINRRLKHPRHKIFGTPGREFWYGGLKDFSDAKLNLVWNAIETKTAHLESHFPLWPAGRQDLISYLFVTCDDFNDVESEDLISHELDETDPADPIIIKVRRRHIDWRDEIAPREHASIEDKMKSVDLRESMTPLVRSTVIKTRPTTAQ